MTENQGQAAEDTEVPHDDELDVEAPNESAPGHHPREDDDETPE